MKRREVLRGLAGLAFGVYVERGVALARKCLPCGFKELPKAGAVTTVHFDPPRFAYITGIKVEGLSLGGAVGLRPASMRLAGIEGDQREFEVGPDGCLLLPRPLKIRTDRPIGFDLRLAGVPNFNPVNITMEVEES